MPVQNFLEDEEYESRNTGSAVPDFLRDEDYDLADSDEYYGGGFAEGAPAGAGGDDFFGADRGDEDLDGQDEEELFDGSELFGEDEDGDAQGEEYSPYGISGVTLRPVVTPVVTVSSMPHAPEENEYTTGRDTTTVPSSADEATPLSSTPNFLEEEDDEPSTPTVLSPSAPSGRAGSGDGSEEALRSGGDPGALSAQRPRRDLSKRSGSGARGITGVGSTLSSSTPTTPVPSSEPTPSATEPTAIRSTPLSPVASLPFRAEAAVEPPSEGEATELKSPSSYAVKRSPKFTALNQSDTTVRRVGADGLTDAERRRAARATVPSKVRTPSTGKLSEEEILFYANFGARRVGDYGSATKKELFLPPALAESAEQKRDRELRINRALAAGSVARGTRSRLTEKDYRVLRFIALFKFSSERQIAKLLQVGEHAAYKRLNGLRKHGLTKGFKTLGVRGSVWMLTETGMDLSGYELPRGTESTLTLSMVSHQFTVNHVAAHLWSGGANVLRERNFPQRNLPDGSGGFDFGERLISELQIQSALGKVRGSSKAEAYVPQIKKHLANQFDNWQRAGGVSFGPSPELQQGNEYMWALYPPVSNRLNYHVPDLVVARPRDAEGKAQSIAVEIELKTKADDSSYERTLDAYRSDDSIYRKVVWICRLKGTAEKLTRIAKKNGLADQGRIAIVPIYLEDGSRFTGKDTWSL